LERALPPCIRSRHHHRGQRRSELCSGRRLTTRSVEESGGGWAQVQQCKECPIHTSSRGRGEGVVDCFPSYFLSTGDIWFC
jgi:cell wall assembly regulator SMI1